MRSKQQQGIALILWIVVTALIIAGAIFAIFMFGKTLGINPLKSSSENQIVSTVETVGDSDEVLDLQKELDDTSFDSLDRDVGDTAKDLNSF